MPGGTRVTRLPGIALRVHFTGNWTGEQRLHARPIRAAFSALLRAAATFRSPRAACGILAAGVQQRLASAEQDLARALTSSPRIRHHAALLCAVRDIGQGADALSEIDFVRLCRLNQAPAAPGASGSARGTVRAAALPGCALDSGGRTHRCRRDRRCGTSPPAPMVGRPAETERIVFDRCPSTAVPEHRRTDRTTACCRPAAPGIAPPDRAVLVGSCADSGA